MRLKSLAMMIMLAAFTVSVRAAEGTILTYWLCYRINQKGQGFDGNTEKPVKDPTKAWLIAPLLGDGKLNYNSSITNGFTLVEQENRESGYQTELPGLVLYSFQTYSGKKASTYGQGNYVDTTDTYEYQRIYSLGGVGAPARGVEPTDKKALLYWSSRLTGSYSMLFKGPVGDPSMNAGTWTCMLDAKTSAAMTNTIDPNKTVADNYTVAMAAFVKSLKLKFDPATPSK